MAMKKMAGGTKKPVAKKIAVTKSRGSRTATQVGNENARENVRVNKYYKNIVSKAEVKGMSKEGKSQSKTFTNARGEKFGANGSEVARARKSQRAGGGKNLGPMEKPKPKAMPAKAAGRPKKMAKAPKGR
jgi:hypothetical protein